MGIRCTRFGAAVVAGLLIGGGSVAMPGPAVARPVVVAGGEYDLTLQGYCGQGKSLTVDSRSSVFSERQKVAARGRGFANGTRETIYAAVINAVKPYGGVLKTYARTVRNGRWGIATALPLRDQLAITAVSPTREDCFAVIGSYQDADQVGSATPDGPLSVLVSRRQRTLRVTFVRRSDDRFVAKVRGNGAVSALWRIRVTVQDGEDAVTVGETTSSGTKGVFRSSFPIRLSGDATVSVVATRTNGIVRRMSLTRNWFF